MLMWHFIFFGEVFIQVLWLFQIQVTCLLVCCYWVTGVLYIIWIVARLYKFKIWYNPMLSFAFVICGFGVIPIKIIVKTSIIKFLPMFSSKRYIVWGFMFRSLIHFNFCTCYEMWSNFFLCIWIFSFPDTICWRLSFPHCYSWQHWRSFDHISKNLISGFSILFHWSTCLYLCQYHPVLTAVSL